MVSVDTPNSLNRPNSSKNTVQGLRSVPNIPQNIVMDESRSSPKVPGSVRGSIESKIKSGSVSPAISRNHSLHAFMAPILGNLTSRSRKNNKINPEIKIVSPDDDVMGSLIVVITDIGAGISKENQQLLFQEGMQFDPEKLQTGGGSGFGEYIYFNMPYLLLLSHNPLFFTYPLKPTTVRIAHFQIDCGIAWW